MGSWVPGLLARRALAAIVILLLLALAMFALNRVTPADPVHA
jgi:ABC-type dipeptide/oligopeptide/nickel transport system permease component